MPLIKLLLAVVHIFEVFHWSTPYQTKLLLKFELRAGDALRDLGPQNFRLHLGPDATVSSANAQSIGD